MNRKLVIYFIFGFFFTFEGLAQDKPKVAVVLSGGGAKGVAHIPLLQVLDSLGIVPDLVVGTSMGSAVGGLYSIGYSGDSIATIAREADWDKILSGETSLDAVGVEEKSEFKRYTVNLDLIDGKPKIKNALLKDQNLREFLSSLLYPAYRIDDFDKLYIPFRAVATDLVVGKEVVLSEGALANAVRASISIPGVFAPVEYKETLLVDGGVMNNFPTDVAKALGADIIIGSDVGEGLLGPDDLDNLPAVLFQTSMLNSGLKSPQNRALCNILIEHSPNLTYSTGDFVKSKEIYTEGWVATRGQMDALVTLANKLKRYDQGSRPILLQAPPLIDRIEYEGISEDNLEFVKAVMNLNAQSYYSVDDLKLAVDRAMGTELFDQITFKARKEEDETILQFRGYERAKHRVGGALHYDTYQGVGVMVNYTGRNVIGTASRLLVGIDIAEQPKWRLQYQGNLGIKRDHWWNLQGYGQNLRQSFYQNGRNGEVLKTRYRQVTAQINKNINFLKDYVGLDLGYFYTRARPKDKDRSVTNVYNLNFASFESVEASIYYLRNTTDKVFFPTSGVFAEARFSRSLFTNAHVDYQDAIQIPVNASTNGYFRLFLDFEKRLKLASNSLVLRGTTGFLFEDSIASEELDIYQYGRFGFYQLGGQLTPNQRFASAFKGLSDGDLLVSQFIRAYLGYQIMPYRNIYITPYLDGAVVGFEDHKTFFNGLLSAGSNWDQTTDTSFIGAVGTTLSYNSLLGPINFDMAYINGVDAFEFFFSVGINFRIQK